MENEIQDAVILCAGQGKDMEPISTGVPKHMIRILGQSVLERVVKGVARAGIKRAVVVIDREDRLTQSEVGEFKERYDIELEWVYQEGQEVLGAVLSAKKVVSKWTRNQFLLAYGDIVANESFYVNAVKTAAESGYPTASAVLQKDIETFGLIRLDEEGFVKDIIEKPTRVTGAEGGYVLGGAFVLPFSFFDVTEGSRSFIDALNILAKSHNLLHVVWQRAWTDLGYPWDILSASRRLLEEIEYTSIHQGARISPTAIVEPPVIIERGAVIEHNAVVRGPAYIGRGAYVGTGALIHGNTSLEEGVVVGAYSEITGSNLQPGTVIGRGCFVGDSVTGRDAVFEPHVTAINLLKSKGPKRLEPTIKDGRILQKIGAIVGNGARIGANTVLYPLSIVRSEEVVPANSILMAK
jgi:glucose-1-phosphate thymidylyltransferase